MELLVTFQLNMLMSFLLDLGQKVCDSEEPSFDSRVPGTHGNEWM